MSEWGLYDAKTIYGTSVSVTNGSTTVDGTGTQFTANLAIGDVIGIHSDLFTKNRVVSIANNTTLTLADPFTGTSNTSLPISFVKHNQQPKYVYQNGGTNGQSGFDALQTVYGVDTTEITSGGANVVSVDIVYGGTKYKEAPAVTFSTGSAAATTKVKAGAVANVTLSSTGGAYASAPTVTIGAPFITFNGNSGVSAAANTVTYAGYLFTAGDAVTYSNGGGTTVPGLTNSSTYYVIPFTSSTFALASSLSNATANVQVDITSTGVGAAHTLTLTSDAATAVADLGVGQGAPKSKVAHAGWVKKTLGSGGRAGRIQYETLVATSSITTDAVDDLSFPDL